MSKFPSISPHGEEDVPRYAKARDWQDILKNRSRFKMHELIERLGLRAEWSANKRGKAKFDSPVVKDMVNDMAVVVRTLPKDSDELITCLAEPDSLKDEVDALLSRHGSVLWGRMGDRVHLHNAGEFHGSGEVDESGLQALYYPRDLYYEDDEDRELIRMLLHWWLGLKACNVILARDRLHRDRKRKAERLEKKQQLEESSGLLLAVGPAAPGGPVNLTKDQVDGLRLDTSYLGLPLSPMNGTPLTSNDSPVSAHNLNNGMPNALPATVMQGSPRTSALSHPIGSRIAADMAIRPSISLPSILQPPSSQQLGAELGNLVTRFLADSTTDDRGHAPSPTHAHEEAQQTALQHGLDLETLKAFRSYIIPSEEGPKWDEAILLRRLETAWRDKMRTSHHLAAGSEALFVARDRAFLTWIELRRHLADLRRADERWAQEEGEDEAVGLEARVSQHKTLMSASRDLARSWEDIDDGLLADCAPEGLTAEHLLVEAFTLLASDHATSDMVWPQMDVKKTVRWLRGHLEQFAAMEAGMEEGLLYVRV